MLTLKAWLDEERGRYTALAAHLGVTLSRVSQMADDGVPVKFMAQVRDFTNDAVSLEALVAARTPAAHIEVSESDHPKAATAKRQRSAHTEKPSNHTGR